MLDFFRKPVFLIILAAALIAAGIWAYISNRRSQQAAQTAATQQAAEATVVTISNLTNVDPATLVDSINAQLTLADAKAAEVDKKLLLSGIEVDLPGTMDRASGTTYFVYSTINDKANNWVIAISNSDNKFVRSRTAKDDYMGNVSAINRSFLKNSYVGAIQIAEKNGGKDYREANTLSEVKLTLKNADPNGWLYWFVNYTSQTNTKTFQIDASAGTLVSSQ